MTDEITKLLLEMAEFAIKAGISTTTLSKRATNSSQFFDRLTHGGDCSSALCVRVRAYISENEVTQ